MFLHVNILGLVGIAEEAAWFFGGFFQVFSQVTFALGDRSMLLGNPPYPLLSSPLPLL